MWLPKKANQIQKKKNPPKQNQIQRALTQTQNKKKKGIIQTLLRKVSRNDYLKVIIYQILKKKIIFEKNYWKVNASHDGYLKPHGIIHDREVEFYPEQLKFIGHDKIISNKGIKNLKFEIRFHLEPNVKVMKTQDGKSILIDLDGEGWKFSSENTMMNIDKGLYFGEKNSFTDNQNIFISGMTNEENQTIRWVITKL